MAWFRTCCVIGGLFLLPAFSGFSVDPAGTNAAPPAAVTNKFESKLGSDEVLRSYLQLQEQIHEAQLTIERNRQESEESAARSVKAVAERLQAIEQSLATQRASELEAVEHANHTMLMVVSAFAALGCLAILFTAYFQWRAVNRFTAISSALPAGATVGPLHSMAALETGDNSLVTIGSVGQVNLRLVGAIERLEKRIQELERTARSPLNEGAAANNILDLQSAEGTSVPEGSAGPESPEAALESTPLLAKGQALLNVGKLEESVACFDEALAQDPDNSEALVKKGVALERLRKPQEALACYDRAIAVDNSMTIAYLYKGGLFNRMERFSEALECYEKALHTQENRRAS